jgi:hypothetical protein
MATLSLRHGGARRGRRPRDRSRARATAAIPSQGACGRDRRGQRQRTAGPRHDRRRRDHQGENGKGSDRRQREADGNRHGGTSRRRNCAKDIKTTQVSIQPVYSATEPRAEPKLTGYGVSSQVNVSIREIAKTGEILDRLVTAGATDVGSVVFSVADPAAALDRAREAAVADARRKAELYARAAGLTLGRVAWITEDLGYEPPVPMGALHAAATRAKATPISTGEDTLHARITVGFDIAR